ncbi:hypothetical protein DYB25_008285 [Aphanomyces astaci]|uniref:Cyclic nucleotide-binding domain-containing protein n=1 Tax=Aphanomyces astaci TaxID=112090 RepID=A0A397A9Q4_APHAT|nr:hypothetical protein DYB25_008285 [Aphanomyces astaci]
MFQHSTNITLSKRLLNAFVRGNDSGLRLAVDGPHATIVHTLVTMCTRVHDALDCLSSPLDVADASQAICTFVTSLDMHKSDADALLQMYVECRRLFYKLDAVLACLVRRVLWLSVLVNCHIALASQCLPQMDEFVKASIVLMAELPSSDSESPAAYEQEAMHAMTDLLSLLVVVPSPSDPLYFVHGFRSAISKFPWQSELGNRARMLVHVVTFLAAWVPDQDLPYAIGYGTYEILAHVHDLLQGSPRDNHRHIVNVHSEILLDLINALAASVELNAHACGHLVKLMMGVVAHHAVLHGTLVAFHDERMRLNMLGYDADDIKKYWRNTKTFLVRGADHPPAALGPRHVAPWQQLGHALHSHIFREDTWFLMRRSGRARVIGPSASLNLATHALLATPTPPHLTSQRSLSPKSKKHLSHHQHSHSPQHPSGHALFTHTSACQGDGMMRHANPLETHGLFVGSDDNDDDDDRRSAAAATQHHFFRLLMSRTRSVAENEDLQDWLLQTYNAAYLTLMALSHGNPQFFRNLLYSVTVVSRGAADFVVRQDETPTGSVFIVMTGQCTEMIRRHRFNLTTCTSPNTSSLRQKPAKSHDVDDLTWRTLHPGDLFGLESIYFQFPFHYISLRADGCVERNRIGVSTLHPTHLLVLPTYPQDKTSTSLRSPSPMDAAPAMSSSHLAAAFLAQTFLLHSLPQASIEFLASHVTPLQVTKDEYLYTAGQPPSIYFVLAGELRVLTPGMQRKGPIPCPRCGLPGHMSDSLVCQHTAHADLLDDHSTAPTRRQTSARNVFLHRRIIASERDIMLDESGLQLELNDADGAGSIHKAMRRMDRALGLLVPSQTFHTRRSSKVEPPPLLTNSPSTPKTLPTMNSRSRVKLKLPARDRQLEDV